MGYMELDAETARRHWQAAALLAAELRRQRTVVLDLEDRLHAILSAGMPPGSLAGTPPLPPSATPVPNPAPPRVSAAGTDPRRIAARDSELMAALVDLTSVPVAGRSVAAPTRGQTLADAVSDTDFDAGRRDAERALGGPLPPSHEPGARSDARDRFATYGLAVAG